MKPTQKTQIEIPTPLHRRTKVRAIQDGKTLSHIVSVALTEFFKAGMPTADIQLTQPPTPRKKKGARA